MTATLRSVPGQPTHRVGRPSAVVALPTRRVRRPRSTPTEAAYRRRRAFAGLVLAGVVGSAGLLAGNVLTGPGGVPASAAGAGTATPARAVRAHAGDSLWSIAETFHGDIPLARYVEALISVNGGTRIEAGQVVELP